MKTTAFKNPLLWKTPARWAAQALKDPVALLSDHVYLERKAASNALELLNRWPEPGSPEGWVAVLASVARDEALHLDMVLKILKRKGGVLQRKHKSDYVSALRGLVRMGHGREELTDRLLISSLTEVRSAERFALLARHGRDPLLKGFYKSLWRSEVGHYIVFLQLAEKVIPAYQVRDRWKELLAAEARIARSQLPGPSLHSGLA